MSETVAEATQPPLLLAKRAMATLAPWKACPNPPTAAAKCPRKEFQQPSEEVTRRKPKKSQGPVCPQRDQEVSDRGGAHHPLAALCQGGP